MPYIEITEKDETSAGVYAEATDVVYIPGFVDISQKCLQKDGKYVGIKKNKPTLFTTVKQFESLCGEHGATFDRTQYYSDLATQTPNGFTGFVSDAIPYHRVMFEKGMTDPSYVMAKEYLNAGLNVLFERVNDDGEYQKVTTEPSDWESSYTNYYTYQDVYKTISEVTPPVWYTELAPGDNVPNKPDGRPVDLFKAIYNKEGLIDSFAKATISVPITEEGGTVTQVVSDLTKVPSDGEHYFIHSTSYYSMEFTPYVLSGDTEDTWVADTYYVESTDDNGEKTLKLVETLQGFDVSKFTPSQCKVKKYTDITLDVDGNLQTLPQDWATTYYNYYVKENVLTNLPESAVTPKFNTHIKYYILSNGINIKNMYNALAGVFDSGKMDGLSDKGNYSIKYLTSGGYPVYEYNDNTIVAKMIDLAVKRGDCVAFIDHTDNPYRNDNIDQEGSIYKKVSTDQTFMANGDFATMFTPWASYNRVTTDKDDNNRIIDTVSTRMPGSYAYFIALGDSIQTNANWLAIAGSTRGVVLNLASDGMTTNIPNGAADAMQPRDGIAVNAITNVNPYGYTIWGNRTLKNNGEKGNLTATSFLNVRNLISDVKKLVYKVSRQLTFEQNNDILWVNFKALIAPTLDKMLSGYGISGYKIIRDTQHEKASEKATICAKIILYPVYAVEDFYITIVLKDDEVSIE